MRKRVFARVVSAKILHRVTAIGATKPNQLDATLRRIT
jgi:hypothetical protein